ncbi:hypothetical protein [Streptomyces platensis]
MRDVPGHQNHADHVRRKPLAPLPDELSGPVRDFVISLRRMHGELGYSLKELESRLPASRSSLSRCLRGQSLPDERLLVQWCTLSFTGEDRLPALVDLLHRAQEAADAGAQVTERNGTPDGETRADADASTGAETETGAAATGGRRRRLVLAVLRAVCRIANGITVTDEVGGHSSMWFRVEHDGDQVWMPAIRIRPEQVENTTLPGCPG